MAHGKAEKYIVPYTMRNQERMRNVSCLLQVHVWIHEFTCSPADSSSMPQWQFSSPSVGSTCLPEIEEFFSPCLVDCLRWCVGLSCGNLRVSISSAGWCICAEENIKYCIRVDFVCVPSMFSRIRCFSTSRSCDSGVSRPVCCVRGKANQKHLTR